VEGCGHGELDKIYETMAVLERKEGKKIDLLICCGDFQVRHCCTHPAVAHLVLCRRLVLSWAHAQRIVLDPPLPGCAEHG
jgi:DNA modification methylase